MHVNVPRCAQSLRRLLGQPLQFDLKNAATKSWLIESGSVRTERPALFLDGELDRVLALSPWRIRATEDVLVRGGSREHGETWAHKLTGAHIVGPFVYCGQFKQRRGYGKESWVANRADGGSDIDQASAASSEFGTGFFGTYLRYDIPLALLCSDYSPPVHFPSRAMHHVGEYRALCDLGPHDVCGRAFVKSLFVFTDFAENLSRRRRYDEIRRRLRTRLGALPQSPFPGVYIRRGKGGESRCLVNERDVEDTLVQRGFAILDPDTMTAEEISRATLDTDCVVAIEGSHISHCIYSAAKTGTLLVLQPPSRFSMCYKEFTDCAEQGFAFAVCTPHPNGFSADIDRLQRLLDLVDRKTA